MRSAGCLLTAGFLGSAVLRSTNFPTSEPPEPLDTSLFIQQQNLRQ